MTCSIRFYEFNGYLANFLVTVHPWLEPIHGYPAWGSDQLAVSNWQQAAKGRAQGSLQKLTADLRRLSQMRIRTFHRRDAKYAEGRVFAQSRDDDWAKDLIFKRGMFLFVVVSRQTKI